MRWILFLKEQYNILPITFCVRAHRFQGLLKVFICFFESTTENAYKNRPKNYLLCDWFLFYNVDSSLAAGKMPQNLIIWLYTLLVPLEFRMNLHLLKDVWARNTTFID